MLYFLSLVFVSGGLSSIIPAREIIKIVSVLFSIPFILYISVRLSLNPSNWHLDQTNLTIQFPSKTVQYPLNEIDHIRAHTRSGGTLYTIYFKNKSAARFWRNKLFQQDDDNQKLQDKLNNIDLAFYKF